MPRPKAPCGTSGAYRRHKVNHERIDDKCQAWKDAEMADKAPKPTAKAAPTTGLTPPARPSTLAELDFVAETLNSLDYVKAAILVAPPSQISGLTKRKSELLHELAEYKSAAEPAERPEVDPLDAALSGVDLSNVTRLDAHTPAAG